MKLYLCAVDIPNKPGIAFVRFAADESGARSWKEEDQKFWDEHELGTKTRIFSVEAEEL